MKQVTGPVTICDMKMWRYLTVLLLGLSCANASDVFQYAVSWESKGKKRTQTIAAYLWVPPKAERVRGLLIGGRILMEPDFVRDDVIREACAEESLGIVYFAPHFSAVFPYRDSTRAGDTMEKALKDLAVKSGMPEVATAPLCPFGHSVASIFASRVLKWKPERCFAAITFKGGFCVGADELEPLRGIPALHIKGQFEEFGGGPSGVLRDFETREASWKGSRKNLLKLRSTDTDLLVGYVVENGSTHMPWTGRLSELTADFIRGAAQLRIPDVQANGAGPVTLSKVNARDGALLDGNIAAPGHKPAPARKYAGPATNALWYPSMKVAGAVDKMHDGIRAKQPQFLTFQKVGGGPIWVRHDMRMGIPAHWVGPDTFKVAAMWLDKPPKKYPPIEGAVGHAWGRIRFQAYGGALEQVKDDVFRIRHDPRATRPCVFAYHPGSRKYRYAEQPAGVGAGPAKRGSEQTISFKLPDEIGRKEFALKLKATSDSGLPVRFWVEYGPAAVEKGARLVLADVPKRENRPIEMAIVAYQLGSHVDPKYRAAVPVRQTMRVR